MATIDLIAEAVKARLNDVPFSIPFTAERKYLPIYELPDMATLRVTVVPKGIVTTGISREASQNEYAIDVAVQKKVAAETPEEIDPLVSLVEEIADRFQFRRLGDYPTAAWSKTENVPVYAVEHLEEFRQFTSVLTFTFKVFRAAQG